MSQLRLHHKVSIEQFALHCQGSCLCTKPDRLSLSQPWASDGQPDPADLPCMRLRRRRALMLRVIGINNMMDTMCCADSLIAAGSRDTMTQSSC